MFWLENRISSPITSILLRTIVAVAVLLATIHVAGFSHQESSTAHASDSALTDGRHLIGSDIQPGIYVAEDIEHICNVRIVDQYDGSRSFSFLGRAIIEAMPSDAEIETLGCGTWRSESETIPEHRLARFGPGTYRVGADIQPGIYTASGNRGRCFWIYADDFAWLPQAEPSINIWAVGDPIVNITADRNGFYSARCGAWTKVNAEDRIIDADIITDGAYLPGIDIPPGTYAADSGAEFCVWYRTSPITGGNSSGGYRSQGHQIATILETDIGFYSNGCGTWKPIATGQNNELIPRSFDKGTFAVGSDIAPDIYSAEAVEGETCNWFILSAFAGNAQDIITAGSGTLRGIVQIPPNAAGFRSYGCEVWRPILELPSEEASTRFGDGEHIVGVHIAPGIYTTPNSSKSRCLWKRSAGFSGSNSDVAALRNAVGKAIVAIPETDATFEAHGCGEWRPLSLRDRDDAPQTHFANGTWGVNIELQPGTYVAKAPTSSYCFWSRMASLKGEPQDMLGSDAIPNHAVMTIVDSDAGVYSDGCGTWNRVNTETTIEHQPATEFSDGVYIVGSDIAAGVYRAERVDQGETCYWSRISGFTGDHFERISLYASKGPAIATILSTDLGFRSVNCGDWKMMNPSDGEAELAETFVDGTFAVGTDILPGNYRADYSGSSPCTWRRMSDFTWNTGVITEVRTDSPTIATIRQTDVGFASSGCGQWTPLQIDPQSDSIKEWFDDGTYKVGADIEPGTYISQTWHTQQCRWARLSSFTADDTAIITQGSSPGRWIVKIEAQDEGFTSNGCGAWFPLANDKTDKSASSDVIGSAPTDGVGTASHGDTRKLEDERLLHNIFFTDGMHRVGIDVLPGVYSADIGHAIYTEGEFVPACSWRRLAGFSHQPSDILQEGFARGKHTIRILPSDTAFQTKNCGRWHLVSPHSE